MTNAEPATRWIALDGAVNARAVVPRVLLRSDNLQSLSERDVQRLLDDHGLEVVVDLRTTFEVTREGPGPMTTQPAVRIEHRSLFPESGNTDLDAPTTAPQWPPEDYEWPYESPLVRAYMSYVRRRPDSIVDSIRDIARSDGAVLVHCAAGKDRTGVVVAIAQDAAGVNRERIVGDYLASGERIDAIIDRLLSSPTYRPELEGHDPRRHAPVRGTMERFFELIDRHLGGSVAWLSTHGLDATDLERLRQRLSRPRTAPVNG